ncbi:hypothetical protein IQ226_01660 [Dolichospermum sp. LEGE 00240]|uniref:NACHT C-terminal helical domain 2-containing protein n=1 Tax=Dolichospermum sp. LEGE 00240 TaxID=1828603 RepID=UPI00187FFFEB|nr:hypothetical protein [Dolichospermum sp. LEGE 00240]MDM3847460.1 hypothetical protein [Aphanizomenon gracile PMC638.10]MDM3850101.1 hypothetical protein [Aphanizomenon gracile PMC627.10]MDM3857581.1 hypothetical protein [Aphanizomenon gracile PMC649.10]MDM3859898.1 hypothetical protein [Aphanizomenon gracile PMC644.10]MBE9247924.1 hypothetical protein [Dolichospermum sp. LEGE 00240]
MRSFGNILSQFIIYWQFSEEQKELLQKYHDANNFLLECLNSDCYVSRDVRQYIEDTLLDISRN